jgi:hypothetical protein
MCLEKKFGLMRKPGRVSAAELAVVPAVDGENTRLDQPSHLSKSAQMLFIKLVASCDHRRFTKSDLPLLEFRRSNVDGAHHRL